MAEEEPTTLQYEIDHHYDRNGNGFTRRPQFMHDGRWYTPLHLVGDNEICIDIGGTDRTVPLKPFLGNKLLRVGKTEDKDEGKSLATYTVETQRNDDGRYSHSLGIEGGEIERKYPMPEGEESRLYRAVSASHERILNEDPSISRLETKFQRRAII